MEKIDIFDLFLLILGLGMVVVNIFHIHSIGTVYAIYSSVVVCALLGRLFVCMQK